MIVRTPAVAGRFYPAESVELRSQIKQFIDPDELKAQAIGIIVPHAGYMYSGHVAGAVYSRIKLTPHIIVLCPNHTGLGPPLSIMRSGEWQTPLGNMRIDEELCTALMAADPSLENDVAAHRREHAIEVQLPFMQYSGASEIQFAPITIGTSSLQRLQELGKAIAETVRNLSGKTLIVASSDMNHYESDSVTRVKDRKAIDQILTMNPEGLHAIVHRENISMCGYGPAASMLTAAKLLGATKAELVKYATSGDVSFDYDHVVGYAGIIVS